MLFNSIRGSPWELQPRAEGGVVNPERQAPPPTVGEQLPRRVCIKRSVELARYGYTDRCIGCQHARYCCYKFTEHQQQLEQQFQFRFQQQSNSDCNIDAG